MKGLNQFEEQGYVVARNMVAKNEIDNIYIYTLNNMEKGNVKDGQVNGSPSFYQDNEMINLQYQLLPKIEEIIRLKIVPTFCYHRVYRKGAILRAHKDKGSCKVAATLNIGQQGELWDLWLIDYDENPQRISLEPGDLLIYKGNQLTHMRGKLVNSDLVSQVLFFFVEQHDARTIPVKVEKIKTFIKKIYRKFRSKHNH